MRKSGILMPVSSLPGNYGIGSFSKESYKFVDFLKKANQKIWQILPLGPTGYGDSPYQSFSTFAGNPYFIDLEKLVEEGLLTQEECEEFSYGNDECCVDYANIYNSRQVLLKKAYERSNIVADDEFQKFVQENQFWLDDYALYMAIKDELGGCSWTFWEEDIKLRKPESLAVYREKLQKEMDCYRFQQYYFLKQWLQLKEYANENGIEIIGDIPIYVSLDSADAWANPELFQLDENCNPKAVAGCPPDAFSADGQLWGNPLYDWGYHKNTGFDWWCRRMEHCFKMYDVVRIDHFRGFDEYFSIPAKATTAKEGHWEQGPGMELFHAIRNRIGDKQIIAEDLGTLTPTVKKLLADSGFPGMKILAFAFDHYGKSDYLPHNYDRNCVAYTGTHDNETLTGWFTSISDEERAIFYKVLGNIAENLCKLSRDGLPEDQL